MKALRAANDGSAISDVIDMLNNLPNEVGSAESFNQEALVEKQFNRQFSSEGHSDEQTSEGHSDEQTAQDSGSKLVTSSATNFQLEDEGKKPEACHIIGSQERETLLPVNGFTMRQVTERSTLFDEEKMGEDDDSQVVKDITVFDSHDEMKRDVGSQCSHEKMRAYGGLDGFGSEDMGDADSDTIYSEGFTSSEEMEDDICEPDDYLEDSEDEDGESERHHDFDENTAEDADACEQPQRMEVDDGNAAFKEIDISSFSFLSPEDRDRIRKLGIGTHVQSKKPSSVSWHFFPALPNTNSYYTSSNVMPVEVVHVSKENAAQFDLCEDKFKGSDFSTLCGILDDVVEVQFERGKVRHWSCVDFSSLSNKRSQRIIDSVVDACVAVGMKFYSFPLMLARVKPATWNDILKTLLEMVQKITDFYTELNEKDSGAFLLVILPDDRQYDEKIKELCEIFKVAYQLCYPDMVDEIFKWELKKVARKIQSKVVKHDLRYRRVALPLVSEAPMIIFGADLFQCMPQQEESIATVAASLDWPKFRKYFVKQSNQPYGGGIIKDLHNSNGGIMINFFNSFYKRINKNPQRIIFFRNGLVPGKFGSICHQEIDAIKRACTCFNSRYQPQFTYVVVLPHTVDMIEMTDESNGNVPGIEDDLIKFRFWCCHRGQKDDTFSLVCYYVLHDDNNFPPRKLQSLTSKLCTFRHRWINPEIDIVPPAYYAQSAAIDAVKEWRSLQSTRSMNGEERS